MQWLQANAGWILSLVVAAWFVVALIRALVVSARLRRPPSTSEQFSRGEKIRHEIRRKIADRKKRPPPRPGDETR